MEVPSVQFWSTCVKTGVVTHMSTGAGDDVLNLRMACLGEAPADGSRTVLFCAAQNKPKAPICILREGSCENQALELKFPGSTKISFSLGGTNPSPVHLSGFIEPLIEMSFGDDEPNAPTEEVASSKPVAEIIKEEQIQVGSKRAAPKASEQDEPPKKKMKDQHKEQEEEKKQEEVVVEDANVSQQPPAEKVETVKESAEEGTQSSQMSTPGSQKKKKGKKKKKRKKFTFDDKGLGVRVTKQGKGPAARKGDTVRVRYIGQLEDDTIFDKNLGEGLVVKLGAGDVIKGWDLGLQGIKVHEKRKMIIPSKLAYGEEGDGKIPANSELWFTLECIELVKA